MKDSTFPWQEQTHDVSTTIFENVSFPTEQLDEFLLGGWAEKRKMENEGKIQFSEQSMDFST